MKTERNEIVFKEDLIVIDNLIDRYKKELKRTCIGYDGKTYIRTRKARLKRLRLELTETLREIEQHANNIGNYWEVEEE